VPQAEDDTAAATAPMAVALPQEAVGFGNRRRAREFAFRVLFEAMQSGQDIEIVYDHALESQNRERNQSPLERSQRAAEREGDEDGELYGEALDSNAFAFAHDLVTAYQNNQDQINDTLEAVIEGWSFNQMAQTDLNILRLASSEMMFLDTPHPPVIEIAVRMAKKYGGDESGRFVNGVLARLLRYLNDDGDDRSENHGENG
jgi:transcription antitermination protein NusB